MTKNNLYIKSSFGFISIALTNAFTWSLKALVKVCCTKLFASFDSRIGNLKMLEQAVVLSEYHLPKP